MHTSHYRTGDKRSVTAAALPLAALPAPLPPPGGGKPAGPCTEPSGESSQSPKYQFTCTRCVQCPASCRYTARKCCQPSPPVPTSTSPPRKSPAWTPSAPTPRCCREPTLVEHEARHQPCQDTQHHHPYQVPQGPTRYPRVPSCPLPNPQTPRSWGGAPGSSLSPPLMAGPGCGEVSVRSQGRAH